VKGLTFLGTGPNSGKSTVAVGLIVLARENGVEVTPFKPVAVADLADSSCPSPRAWEHPIHHHETAAGIEYRWQHNPVTLVPDAPYAESPVAGRLYVRGEDCGVVGLLAEDTIDHDSLAPGQRRAVAEAVEEAIAWHRRHSRVVVMEGSGALDQRPDDDDIVNRGPAAALGLPAVLMTKGWSPAKRDALQRCIVAAGALRDRDPAPILDHVLLNGVDDLSASRRELDALTVTWGLRVGGVVETIRFPTDDGAIPGRAERHRIVSDAVRRGLTGELLAHVLDTGAVMDGGSDTGCLRLEPARGRCS